MSKKILIIEDNKDLRRLYRVAFEKKGFEVSVGEEGISGIQKALSIQPDIILLDILMPHSSGYDVVEAIRMNKMDTKIIVLSNIDDSETVGNILKSGADNFYCKIDYSPRKMVEEIEKILEANN